MAQAANQMITKQVMKKMKQRTWSILLIDINKIHFSEKITIGDIDE
jgi:hypothetical protein